jgi:hypothetical protein
MVTLQLSSDYECTLEAEVVHVLAGKNAFGVEFRAPLNEETRRFLRELGPARRPPGFRFRITL